MSSNLTSLAAAIGMAAVGLPAWTVRAEGPAERPAPRISVRPAPTAPSVPIPPDDPLFPGEKVKPGPSTVPLPPDVPPLGLPSDGEAAPSFPDLPDLPGSSTSPDSLLPPINPDTPDPSLEPDLPAPGDPPAETRPPAPALRPAPPASSEAFAVWHQSPRRARDLAAAQRRCLLLVFSNRQGAAGSTSKQLSDEVLATDDFNRFALDHLVLCNLFFGETSNIQKDAELARTDALENAKRAFKVRGFPCMILFGPDGKEINRWSGYIGGRSNGYFQRIKQAVEGHEAVIFEVERRRAKMAERGYRTWTSAQGRVLFAKLIEFDAHRAVLRDEAGSEVAVNLNQLALPDRELITRKRLGRPLPRVDPPPAEATTLR